MMRHFNGWKFGQKLFEITLDYDKCQMWRDWRWSSLKFSNVNFISKDPLRYEPWKPEYIEDLEISYRRPLFRINWDGDFTWQFGYPTLKAVNPENWTSTIYPTRFKHIYALVEIEEVQEKNNPMFRQTNLSICKKFGPANLYNILRIFENVNSKPDKRARPMV